MSERRPTFFSDERQRPGEDVKEVWQPVGVRYTCELTDIHHIVLILQYRRYTDQQTQAHGGYFHQPERKRKFSLTMSGFPAADLEN